MLTPTAVKPPRVADTALAAGRCLGVFPCDADMALRKGAAHKNLDLAHATARRPAFSASGVLNIR
jgi:hypothetical protein